MFQEIERKWLLSELPDFMGVPVYRFYQEQAYLAVTKDIEVRIRRNIPNTLDDGHRETFESYLMTVKGAGELKRPETNLSITQEEYCNLRDLTKKPPIWKECISVVMYGQKVFIAKVDNDFVYAEVEFDTVEEAMNYKFPFENVLVREVTFESDYYMKNYWIKTRG